MMKTKINLTILLSILFFFYSCQEEKLWNNLSDLKKGEDLPVLISANLSETLNTRGEVEGAKINFSEGELIHITGTFTLKDNQQETRYGAFEFQGGKWVPFGEISEQLKWPSDAVSGKFTAYFIDGSTGLFNESQGMEVQNISFYKDGNDPLVAYSEDLPYGHTVALNFFHILSHLTILDLEAGISQNYYITKSFVSENDNEDNLNNGFRLIFKDKGLIQEFSRIPDTQMNNMVYVSGNTETYLNEDAENRGKVSFFLEPGLYNRFNLIYPQTNDTYKTYISYSNTLADLSGDKKKDLIFESNGRYELSVIKSSGIIIKEQPEEGWDNSEPEIKIDVEKFLRAVQNGESYIETVDDVDVIILEATELGTRLVRNVDFDFFYYDIFPPKENEDPFIPNLSLTFDGDYHYIYNLSCPLFNDNNGNILNLGIKNVTTLEDKIWGSNVTFEKFDKSYDFSLNGALARENNGVATNLRFENIDIKVKIHNPQENQFQNHSVGLIFGENKGYLSDISLSGDFKIVVENYETNTIMPTINLGGLVGQNSKEINKINPLGSMNISIINKCSGETGNFYVGGITGNNTSLISNILLPDINIDCSESSGLISYIGGISGRLPVSTPAPELISCISGGSLKSGQTQALGQFDSANYIGGLAGYATIQTNIKNCSSFFSIFGQEIENSGVQYASGGIIGRIGIQENVEDGNLENLSGYGEKLEGVGPKGTFAGITPINYDWENYYSSKNINVKSFEGLGLNPVGENK